MGWTSCRCEVTQLSCSFKRRLHTRTDRRIAFCSSASVFVDAQIYPGFPPGIGMGKYSGSLVVPFPTLPRSLGCRHPDLLWLRQSHIRTVFCLELLNPNGCLGNTSRFLTKASVVQKSKLRSSINQLLHPFDVYERRSSTSVPWKKIKHFELGTYAHVHESHHQLLIPLALDTTSTSSTGDPEMGCRLRDWGWGWDLFRRSPCEDI